MKLKLLIFLILFLVSGNILFSQRNKKHQEEEIDPAAAFRLELAEYRKSCRNSIKPYRYEGIVTTYFTYKNFNYVKEVEISTNQRAKYKVAFNAKGIHHEKIHMRIYDKPAQDNDRFMLAEKLNVGEDEFELEFEPMLDRLIQHRKEKGVDQAILDVMRIKRIYVDYVIPGVDRDIQVDEETGEEKVLLKKGAIVCAIGYSIIDY